MRKKMYKYFFQNFPVARTKGKKIWSRNLKWATAHFSTGWAGRRACGTARAQGRWAWRHAVRAHRRGEHWRRACGRGERGAWGAKGAWQRHAGRGMREAGVRSERWARGLARVVHLVHSACFWPGLTQYCS